MWIKWFKRLYIYHCCTHYYIHAFIHHRNVHMCSIQHRNTFYVLMNNVFVRNWMITWICIYLYIYIDIYSFASRYHCCGFVDGLTTFLFFQEYSMFYLKMSSAKWRVYMLSMSQCVSWKRRFVSDSWYAMFIITNTYPLSPTSHFSCAILWDNGHDTSQHNIRRQAVVTQAYHPKGIVNWNFATALYLITSI